MYGPSHNHWQTNITFIQGAVLFMIHERKTERLSKSYRAVTLLLHSLM